MFDITGFLANEKIRMPNTIPTPTATPASEIKGTLLARYLNPNKIRK